MVLCHHALGSLFSLFSRKFKLKPVKNETHVTVKGKFFTSSVLGLRATARVAEARPAAAAPASSVATFTPAAGSQIRLDGPDFAALDNHI